MNKGLRRISVGKGSAMRRWIPRIILLLSLGLWFAACFGVQSDIYLFQHGKRYRTRIRAAYSDEHIIGRRSLCVSTRSDYVVIHYQRMEAGRFENANPTFSHSIGAAPSFGQLRKPYIENTRFPDPNEMQQDFVQVPMPPDMEKQVRANLQANGVEWNGPLTIPQPVGPLHKRGPVDPAMQMRTVIIGIPYWLIFLPAALISSLQFVRWWRRGRKEGRGFDVQGLHYEAPVHSSVTLLDARRGCYK